METKKTNALEGYELFLKKYPNSIYESQARRIIDELEWKEVRSLDTIDAYNSFLQKYPNSTYTFQAKLRFTALQDDLSKWEMAQKENTIKSYSNFIKENPNSFYAKSARAKIVDLEVSDIIKRPHGELPPPEKIINEVGRPYSIVDIFNNTKYSITIRYSGPDSFKIIFAPGEKKSIQVLNGKYRVTASANAINVRNYAGEEVFDGSNYDVTYYIKSYSYNVNTYQPNTNSKFFQQEPSRKTFPEYEGDLNNQPVESWPIRKTFPEYQQEYNSQPHGPGPIRRTIPDNLQ
jgi:hypothetical protein